MRARLTDPTLDLTVSVTVLVLVLVLMLVLTLGSVVVVVDADRPVKRHGIPPARLKCELAALGLRLERFQRLGGSDSFFAAFRAAGPRPAPGAIKPCQEPA